MTGNVFPVSRHNNEEARTGTVKSIEKNRGLDYNPKKPQENEIGSNNTKSRESLRISN